MATIHVEHLRRLFKNDAGVRDLSLEIRDGELMVLVGPSGCGKTTTLNCIAGLERPDEGVIRFDGEDVTSVPPHERDIAMVFQSSLLYPHLTGEQNIRMSLKRSRLAQDEVDRRVKAVSEMLSIAEVLPKLPAHMSGGERQRVAIAKALVREPAAFLMDEPLANLDAALREGLRAEIAVLQKRVEITTVLVTHDQVEAMTMGDRIAVMNKGEICQVGTPHELYTLPADTFVATFIGSPPMHLFPGRVETRDEGIVFRHPGLTLPLGARVRRALEDAGGAREVLLGARPQHMELSAKPSEAALQATVYAVEELGKESVTIVTTEGGEQVKVLGPPAVPWTRGTEAHVALDPEAILLFDAHTGKNLLL